MKQNKKAMNYTQLAQHLFELETEHIANDSYDHFAVMDWLDKYGEDSYKLADKFITDKEAVKEIAKYLKKDFKSGYWIKDGEKMYHPEMISTYGGIIDKALEKQIALLTVGYQTQLTL